MREADFRVWLGDRYTPASVSSRLTCARKVEEQYGDLDLQYEEDGLEELIASLHYSLTDAKIDAPNPTRITTAGNPYNVLNNCKTGVRSYRAFRQATDSGENLAQSAITIAAEQIAEKKEGKQFELEAHLQKALRAEIEQLEPGLFVIDDGLEVSVNSGDIDISAQDMAGAYVVIELKRGLARRDTVGQIAGYMGDLMAEEPNMAVRGIIVAGDFDKSCLSAIRAIPNLALRRYRFSFTFDDPTNE